MGKPVVRGAMDRESVERLIAEGAIVFSLGRTCNGRRQTAAQQQLQEDRDPAPKSTDIESERADGRGGADYE